MIDLDPRPARSLPAALALLAAALLAAGCVDDPAPEPPAEPAPAQPEAPAPSGADLPQDSGPQAAAPAGGDADASPPDLRTFTYEFRGNIDLYLDPGPKTLSVWGGDPPGAWARLSNETRSVKATLTWSPKTEMGLVVWKDGDKQAEDVGTDGTVEIVMDAPFARGDYSILLNPPAASAGVSWAMTIEVVAPTEPEVG